jgi:hypothetical protein
MFKHLIPNYLLKRYRRLKHAFLYRNQPPEAIFAHIYQKNRWADGDSLSGTGSNNEQTRTLVQELGPLIKKLGATSLLDIPCGDFHWMKNVDLTGIHYTGADIVKELVFKNQNQYGQAGHTEFIKLNLLVDTLPKADVILIRDCLVHFSYKHIQQALQNIRASGYTYLLTTTFPEHPKNTDITTGNWRTLNLEAAPFFFPKPLLLLNENCTEGAGMFADKSLGFWRVDLIPGMAI